MAENSVEERMLELIEEICDDEIIREERAPICSRRGCSILWQPLNCWWPSRRNSA